MTPFEHLSVLVSIVIGLGIAHLLSSAHRLVQARDRVRPYWLSLMWAGLILVTQIEWWWATFEYREQMQWNFFYFLFMLLSPIALYLAAAFVLPDVEPGVTYDLREYYYGTRRWLFSILALNPALDAVRRAFEAGSILNVGASTNAIAAVLIASLAVSDREAHHAVLTLAVTALFGVFLVSAALQLTG